MNWWQLGALLAILLGLHPALSVIGDAEVGIQSAVSREVINGATCASEVNIALSEASAAFRFNLTDNPSFKLDYTVEGPLTGTNKYYITAALIWDNTSLSSSWSNDGNYRVPGAGKYYAYDKNLVSVTASGDNSGTIDLGNINSWDAKASGVTGLNHTGPFRFVVNVRSTTTTVSEVENWYADNEGYDQSFGVSTCSRNTTTSKKGWIMTYTNITSFDTYHNSSYDTISNNLDDKFMRGEVVYIQFKANGKEFARTNDNTESGDRYEYLLNISNSSGHTVSLTAIAANNAQNKYTVSWTVPDTIATKNYNVTLFVNKTSDLTNETWTYFIASDSIELLNANKTRIIATTMTDPTGETSSKSANFWVEKSFIFTIDSINVTYINRGEDLVVNSTVKDAWGAGLDALQIALRYNSTSTKYTASTPTTNRSGSVSVVFTIPHNADDTYSSANYGVSETKDYSINVHLPSSQTTASSGSYAALMNQFDVDSNLYINISARGMEGNDHYRQNNKGNFTSQVFGVRGQNYSNLSFLHWWDYDWAYRQNITLSNAANTNTLTSYAVKVSINTATLISQSKLMSNASDLRFVDSDDITELPYWIESGWNTAATNIWIKVNATGSSSKTIYVYYGNNNTVANKSNGSSVFEYFNDFSGDPQIIKYSALGCTKSDLWWNSTSKRIEFRLDPTDGCAVTNDPAYTFTITNISSFIARGIKFRFNATHNLGGTGTVNLDVLTGVNSTDTLTEEERLAIRSRATPGNANIVGSARYVDGNPATDAVETSTDSRPTAFNGLYEAMFNSSGGTNTVVYRSFNSAGSLLAAKQSTVATGSNINWGNITFKVPGFSGLATLTGNYTGWIDDFIGRNVSSPEPTLTVVSSSETYIENNKNITFSLKNSSLSTLYINYSISTDSTANFSDSYYTFTQNVLCELWNATAQVIYKGNNGSNVLGFFLSNNTDVCSGGGIPANISIRSIITMSSNRVKYSGFLEGDMIIISSNVTHGSGNSLILNVTLNLTYPNGTRHLVNTTMTNTTNITNGYQYEYNFTTFKNARGTWTIDIYASSTDSGYNTSSDTFLLNGNREIAAVINPSFPFTLQINGSRGSRSSDLPITRG